MKAEGSTLRLVATIVVLVCLFYAAVIGWHEFQSWRETRRVASVPRMASQEAEQQFVDASCLSPPDGEVDVDRTYCDALRDKMTRAQMRALICPSLVSDPKGLCDGPRQPTGNVGSP